MARLSAAVECERLLRSSGSFDLTFFCPDPFGYAIEDETFSITEAGNSTVTRLIGNMESNPIYRIEGVITSGAGNSISITTNGQELKIVNATLAGMWQVRRFCLICLQSCNPSMTGIITSVSIRSISCSLMTVSASSPFPAFCIR